MPRDGSITFGDLIGKLDVVRLECKKCGRSGWYPVRRLIEQHGRDGKMTDWKADLTADCPRRKTLSDYCGARCPDLVRAFLGQS